MENHNCYWYNYRKSPFLSGKSAISMAIFGHMVIPGHPTDHCPEKAGRCPGAPRHLLYMGGRLGIGDTINKKNMDIYIYMIAVYIYMTILNKGLYIYMHTDIAWIEPLGIMNQLSIFAEVGGVNMLPKWLFIVGFTTLLVY